MDASSRGRTSRAHVAWLVPAALASTLLLSAAAVASNFQQFTDPVLFNAFVTTGSSSNQVFTGDDSQPQFFYPSGGSSIFSYSVTAKDASNNPVNVALLNSPFGSVAPDVFTPGNQLFFEKQPSSASISAFGGFFSLRNWANFSGNRTSGEMTLTAFDGPTQVYQHTFTLTGIGPTFFGIGANESNPITRVQLTGASPLSAWTVNAEEVTVGVVPVPEPSTLALGGGAILAIVFARRMKPRKARAVIGVSIAILAMHVTSTMADSSVTSRPPDTAVIQGVDGRPAAPPMEPLVPSVASSL